MAIQDSFQKRTILLVIIFRKTPLSLLPVYRMVMQTIPCSFTQTTRLPTINLSMQHQESYALKFQITEYIVAFQIWVKF